MFLSAVKSPRQYGVTVSRFLGLDVRKRCESGAFVRMKNLCGDACPALMTRRPRGVVTTLTSGGGLVVKDALCWVDGTKLYINGLETGLILSRGKKQLISMGAYLIVWPDKVYINTADVSQYGSLENRVTLTGEAETCLCDQQGEEYHDYATGSAPLEPARGTTWLDEAHVLHRWDGSLWQEVVSYVKVEATGIGVGFHVGDGVNVQGMAALEGQYLIKCCADNALVLSGNWNTLGTEQTTLSVERKVPDMDFVVECNNRLWGCKYGMVGGRAVNEIYASALGDFCNFHTYAGLSTDAYAAQRGSDGPFTGAISFLGNPLFFKENGLEKVYVSATGAHQIVYTPCPGVAAGSGDSLQVVDSSLYYLGAGGIYRYDGAMPVKVSDALGEEKFRDGVAGGKEGKYYLSAINGADEPVLLSYHTALRRWYQEDDLRAAAFAASEGELYCLDEDGTIWAMGGSEGTTESGKISWSADTGDWGLDDPAHKYLTRLDLRCQAEKGAVVTVFVSYDGGRRYHREGQLRGTGGVVPQRLTVHPRRAPQIRLRFQGQGACTIFSLRAVYDKGSDVV